MKKGALRQIPVHIFLFGIYPLLFLWSVNYDQIPVFALSRAFVFSLVLIFVSFLVSFLVFRNLHKAGVFTSFFLLLFYIYGHLFPILDKITVFGFVIGRHRYLLAALLLILAASAVILLRIKPPKKLNGILNITSAVLIGMVLFSVITPYILNPKLIELEMRAYNNGSHQLPAKGPSQEGRDVYYIVLDAYGREDLLREESHLDNSAFLQELEKIGFVVQDCAFSNYARTPLSMGSALNMNYLDHLGAQEDPGERQVQYNVLGDLLQHSLVRKKFEEMGYQFITFKGVYSWLNIEDSDLYIDSEKFISIFDRQETINFHDLFLRTSALMYLFDLHEESPQEFAHLPTPFLKFLFPNASIFSTREYKQYEANLYALDRLKEMPEVPGKKFVYAHLYITHQPYVFNPDGSFRWPPFEDINAYNDQIRFINPRMIDILKEIIRKSKTPPIIVVQGDHSFPLSPNRTKIINAYFLPENGNQALYPEITPVNTFRLIFNQYFGMNYPLLEDHSYYSEGSSPYKFEEIPLNCPSGQ